MAQQRVAQHRSFSKALIRCLQPVQLTLEVLLELPPAGNISQEQRRIRGLVQRLQVGPGGIRSPGQRLQMLIKRKNSPVAVEQSDSNQRRQGVRGQGRWAGQVGNGELDDA